MKTIDTYWNGMGEDITMGRRWFAIWGYMRIWMNCCQPHTIPHSNLQINLNSTKKTLKADQSDGRCVPRWSKMSHWPVLPRLPPCTFLQLWINKQKRNRKSYRWEVTIWKSCMSHQSSARTQDGSAISSSHALKAVLQMYSLDLRDTRRNTSMSEMLPRSRHVRNVLKCSGSEPPQSSKAPTRGDRLRSDIVQSEMSVPQILHVEWKFKATCTTQAMLLAPWKLLIPCGLFASRAIQSIFEANSLCFSAYLVSPVFTLFSPRFTEVTWGLGKSRAARGNGIGRWADEQMLLREATDFQRPNAINLHILMIHVFSVLSAVSLCEVTSL